LPITTKFTELISIAMDKALIDRYIMAVIKDDSKQVPRPKVADVPYISRVLDEEICKPFPDPMRPVVELVTNAIDAKPHGWEGRYCVDIRAKGGDVTVSDYGSGMALREMLGELIIPFNTKKPGKETYGRFGVGFLSNLQYCLKKPGSSSVTVESAGNHSNGARSYKLRFHSTGKEIKDLKCTISGSERKQGTDVTVERGSWDWEHPLEMTMRNYFHWVGKERAEVHFNGELLNRDDPIWQTVVPLSDGQDVRVAVDPASSRDVARFYSQGVLIYAQRISHGEVRMDLPSVVDVVEGRSNFREDENYDKALEAAWSGLLRYARQAQSKGMREGMRMLLGGLPRPHKSKGLPNAEEFRRALFREDFYLVSPEDAYRISDFFGEDVKAVLFPAGGDTYKAWESTLPDAERLVKDHCKEVGKFDLDRYVKKTGVSFSKDGEGLKHVGVKLFRYKGGASPFLRTDGKIYCNLDSPLLARDDFVSTYAVLTGYLRACGVKEEEIENRIISGE